MVNGRLRVAIDARLPDQGQGGVQQVLNTLAAGMLTLDRHDIERHWVVLQGTTWWRNVLPADDHFIQVQAPLGGLSLKFAQRFPQLTSHLFPLVSKLLPKSALYDDLLLKHSIDVVHLPFQDGFKTNLPYVYNPHDLQHKYFPSFFTRHQIKHRESVWRERAQNASIVMAASEYVSHDLQKFWNIKQQLISIVPIPPPQRKNVEDSILRDLPVHFGLYPAAYWPHKNHSNLLRAIALLREKGIEIPMVFTGAQVGEYQSVQKLIWDLGLTDIVFCLGHVTNEQLTSLLKTARFVAVPSQFEALSLVVWDAQLLGTPVVCSNVVPFPAQVGNTALTFDPLDIEDIASSVERMWTDDALRHQLSESALVRTNGLSAKNYALAMISEYFKAARAPEPEVCASARQQLLTAVDAPMSD